MIRNGRVLTTKSLVLKSNKGLMYLCQINQWKRPSSGWQFKDSDIHFLKRREIPIKQGKELKISTKQH